MADVLGGEEEDGGLVVAEEEAGVFGFGGFFRGLINKVEEVPKRHHRFRSREPPMPKLDLYLLRLQTLFYVSKYFRSPQKEPGISTALSGRRLINDLSVDREVELD